MAILSGRPGKPGPRADVHDAGAFRWDEAGSGQGIQKMTGGDFPLRALRDQVDSGVPLEKLFPVEIKQSELTVVEFNAEKFRALLKEDHIRIHTV